MTKDADKARAQLLAYAEELNGQAVDQHIKGMALLQSATRMQQLATICSDEAVIRLRDECVKNGLLVIIPAVNAPGGNA